MCGRFTLKTRLNQLLQLYSVESQIEWEPRWNIAPTQNVLTIRTQADRMSREAALMKWGLIPSWSADTKIGSRMINARAETVAEKNSFKTALKKRRCLVIADGFYEWPPANKDKQPIYVRFKDQQPFAFAGLWEQWKRSGETIESCTIITTQPNRLMAAYHDRMPVILPPESIDTWLDPEIEKPEQLTPILMPYPNEDMEVIHVSKAVNSPKHDLPDCIVPI